MVNLGDIKKILEQHFDEDNIFLEDETGDGRHLFLQITSDKFKGVSRLERQRLIFKILENYMPNIHALSLKLSTHDNN